MTFDPASLLLSADAVMVAALALLIERLFGYPDWVFNRIRHPVVWMGALVSGLDRVLNNRAARPFMLRLRGILAVIVLLLLTLAVAVPVALALRNYAWGWVAEAVLASTMLCQKALGKFVGDVATGLDDGVEQGREALSHIVSRDLDVLDESGLSKGAIESLAENTSDGIVAPLLWLLVGGLPGAAAYKMINTADSMVGYRSKKYFQFGWCAARLDDLVNLPASRLTGFVFAAGAELKRRGGGAAAVTAMLRDASQHISPNAGWPEAALAGALDIRLGGARNYGSDKVNLAWMGNGRPQLTADDIRDALGIYWSSLNVVMVPVLLAGLAAAAYAGPLADLIVIGSPAVTSTTLSAAFAIR